MSTPAEIQRLTQEALDNEYFTRTKSASVTFALVALYYFFNEVHAVQYLFEVKALCMAAFVVNIVRLIFAIRMTVGKNRGAEFAKLTKYLTALNGLLWGTIIYLVLLENNANQFVFALVFVTASGYAAASILTLNMYIWLSSFFQASVLLPFIYIHLREYHQTGNPENIHVPVLMTIFYVFTVYQTKIISKHLIERYKNEIELKFALEEVKYSQEQLLEQTKKMVHSSRLASLGEMAGGVAHEVNNPLAVILGHVQQLDRASTKENRVESEFVHEKSEKIISAVNRISKIIKGLRQFSQQADAEPMAPASIENIMMETLDMCNEKFRSNNIELQIQGDLKKMINCRSVQISQILINLLNNAYDVITEKSEKGIVQIQCETIENEVRIRVANTGPIISEEAKQKLFQPFFTTKELGKGTGLGLSISRGIARDHGGDIYLIEGLEQTTFEVRLPLLNEKSNEDVA